MKPSNPSVPAREPQSPRRPKLLAISASFPPEGTPTAIRAGSLLSELAASWDVSILTAQPEVPAELMDTAVIVPPRHGRLLTRLHRLRLRLLAAWLLWPDPWLTWVPPAIRAAVKEIRRDRPDIVLIFMMPYSTGLVGLALRKLTGLPVVLNLDDAPTCTDMHPTHPTRLHARLALWLENAYAKRSDALIYVSQRNLETASARLPERMRRRLHLIRYGAHPNLSVLTGKPKSGDTFRVVYVGGMSGWRALHQDVAPASLGQRVMRRVDTLGQFTAVELDHRTSSPAVLGTALKRVLEVRTDLIGQLSLDIYSSNYDAALIDAVLSAYDLQSVVRVLPAVPHDEVEEVLAAADLLFIALPNRRDGSPGGRISAKTYEYLQTDRPILAAVPSGENADFLIGQPGTWVVRPDDVAGMVDVVLKLLARREPGRLDAFDRSAISEEISYRARAEQLDSLLRSVIEARDLSARRSGDR